MLGTQAIYFYNLGTENYHQGKVGLAYAYLEKARTLDPSDSDIQWNTERAREALSRLLGGEDKLDPSINTIAAISENFPWVWAYWILGMGCLLMTLLWAKEYKRNREPRRAVAHPFAGLSLTCLLCLFSIIAWEWQSKSSPVGICIQADLIRSGPGESYSELARVDAGVKLRFFEATYQGGKGGGSDVWRQIRYSKTGIGWIRESSMLLL